MKQEIHPIALVGAIVVLVALIAVFGYRALQPAPYTPSPGVVGGSGAVPGSVQKSARPSTPEASATPAATPAANASATNTATYYPSAPPGSIPGKPVNSGH